MDTPPDGFPPELAGRFGAATLLGRGGFGAVFRARDPVVDREVAIKVLEAGLGDPGILARFEREAKVTAALRHPHVVEVFDYGVTAGGTPFIVYEFVDGPDLHDFAGARGGLPEADVRVLGAALADALAVAHAAGVVHRDVKPENVLVRADGSPVLCDLGLARLAEAGATMLTAEGVMMGTPDFMAPELYQGHPASPASDQFALAASLFRVLYGTGVYPHEGIVAILEALKTGELARFPPGAADRDPGLVRALRRALQADPAARYPDAAAFGRVLAGPEQPGATTDEGSSPLVETAPPAASEVDRAGRTRTLRPGPGATARLPVEATRTHPVAIPPPVDPGSSPRAGPGLAAGAAVLLLVAGWFLGGPAPPDEVRFQVVGDALVVEFRGGPPGTTLEVDGARVGPGPEDLGDGRRRQVHRGLRRDATSAARLVWDGGGTAPVPFEAGEDAIEWPPTLAPGRSLALRLRRPVVIGGTEVRGASAGIPPRVPGPPAMDGRLPVRWEEAGLAFERALDLRPILRKVVEDSRFLVTWRDPARLQALILKRRPDLEAEYRDLQESLGWLPSWSGDLFALAGEDEVVRLFLALQEVQRATAAREGRVPPGIRPGAPGWRGARGTLAGFGEPRSIPASRRPRPRRSREGKAPAVYMWSDPGGLPDLQVDSLTEAFVRWPTDLPAEATAFALTLGVKSFAQSHVFQFEGATPGGEAYRLDVWCEPVTEKALAPCDPKQTVVIPAAVAPRPGDWLTLRYRGMVARVPYRAQFQKVLLRSTTRPLAELAAAGAHRGRLDEEEDAS